ncbi:hypothetical protein D3C78_1527470 [compost metagenome]
MALWVLISRLPRTMMTRSSGLPPEFNAAFTGLIVEFGCRSRSPSKNSQVVAPASTVMTPQVPRLPEL